MDKKLYVGNLAPGVAEADLARLFAPYGMVVSAKVVRDRDTGQSRCFGFVEMAHAAEAERAVRALDHTEVEGQELSVSEALPRPASDPRDLGTRRGGYDVARRW
jgi:RNA recognition motif-containing protein